MSNWIKMQEEKGGWKIYNFQYQLVQVASTFIRRYIQLNAPTFYVEWEKVEKKVRNTASKWRSTTLHLTPEQRPHPLLSLSVQSEKSTRTMLATAQCRKSTTAARREASTQENANCEVIKYN